MLGFTADALERGGLDLVTSRLQELLEEPESVARWRDLVRNRRPNASTCSASRTGGSFER